ncbi:transcriptional regulator LicR [Bacillus halotolerans]|uniref:transcriptional regulator LicR n=1 Tax=Bacillus TaxID=1386 RepID=UPI0003A67BD7|nr:MULTISPECIES: transcriptional regulator LicR [Bacillus]MCP9298043.1 BglG family transcription antiterminator [Bacillus halotolerans]MCV0023802.1 BglG family transcription antiterminator [Bacillus sp. XT-2]MEC1601229.1 transcriptional regulator LicR [Bacillus halotolerans]PRS25350.1 PRD domain-containing protein [Bacillus halotolerans]QNH40130.1 transcription antiterminator [Bacillus sp. PAMC26543]
MLHGRLREILRLLMAAEVPVTSSVFAAHLHVTTRTVRNDIKELQDVISGHGALVQSVRGSGYKLRIHDEQTFRTLLQDVFQQKKGLPVFPEERITYLMKRLLLADHYLKLDELAEELFISKSTLQTDLKEVKKRLLPYRIVMETRPNYGFKLRGDEVQMRYCMAEYIVDERETEIDFLNEKADILPKEEIEIIHSVIMRKIKNDRIPLSNLGLNNLIIHIAIACKRIRTEHYVSLFPEDMDHILHQKEYQAAEAIVKELESALSVTFPENETAYIAMHLLGTKRMTQPQCGEGEFSIDEETDRLTAAMIEAVDRELKLGILHDQELKIGLALHVKPAITRNRYGMNLRNPMLAAIKENYPLAFEAGIIAGIVIKEKTGIDIHENEVGYLALHFGAAIERKKTESPPKRCIIVCASGAGSAQLLREKLRSHFGKRIDILGTAEYYSLDQLSYESIDFVVSTIPIKKELPVPVLKVNTILGGTDFTKIESILNDEKEKAVSYLKKDLVFFQKDLRSKEEVIQFLGQKAVDGGYANKEIIDSIFDREEMSPTCFGNLVAIPHPLVPQTQTTFWAVCTLKKPIDWENKRVQFVCLLCVEKENKADLQSMYKLLGSILDDPAAVSQLLKSRTYQELSDVFDKKR